MLTQIRKGDALIVVDMQYDFVWGTLPVPRATEIVPVVRAWVMAFSAAELPVVFSKDWHPREHPSFTENGGVWPRHCVAGTDGARFLSDLYVPDNAIIVHKGTRFDEDQYSAFDETGLHTVLRRRRVERVWVCGLALDVCVRATGNDAARYFAVSLVPDGSRGLDPEQCQRVRQTFHGWDVEGV